MKIAHAIKPTANTYCSIAAKQMYAILIALFITSIVLILSGAAYANSNFPVAGSVKWHPGHYYTVMSNRSKDSKYLKQVYRELKETPALRGIQIRYKWAELEPEEGRYNFASIDQHLAELAAQQKRLIILLHTKSFTPKAALVPDYLKENIYEDGVFAYGNYDSKIHRGYSIKLWNPKVHDRLVALISALGARYNSHPYFEGIGLTETAMGQPLAPLASTQVDGYYNNLLTINQELRKHFPNTMTFQFTNYPRSILKSFVSNLSAMGTGLGGPDTFLDDPGLHSNIYTYYPELSGIVPLTPSVMPPNYVNTRHDNKGREPTILELFTFARDKLKANYIFWTRAPDYYSKVLEMLNGLDLTNDPAGGLDATCPKAYASCVD